MDKVCYTSVTTWLGTPNSFTRGIFIWVIQRIGKSGSRSFLLCISLPPVLSQNGFIGTKADRILIAWRNFTRSIGPPSAAPQNSPLRAVQRAWDLNTLPTIVAYLARHGCYRTNKFSHHVIIETLHLLTIGMLTPFVPSTAIAFRFFEPIMRQFPHRRCGYGYSTCQREEKVFPSLTNSRHTGFRTGQSTISSVVARVPFPHKKSAFSRQLCHL